MLNDTYSIEAPGCEWDPYASSPTYSNPSKSVSFSNPSNKSPSEERTSPFPRWTSSRRPIKKNWGCKSCPNSGREPDQDSEEENELFDDKKSDPDYQPKSKRKLKRQTPLNKCRKPDSFRRLDASSSDDEPQAPPRPPRLRRTSSVLVISRASKPHFSN